MILTGLLLGAALGFTLQRGRFCVTGAFRDLFLTRSTRWFSAFLLVVAIQSVGVFALTQVGLISPVIHNFAPLAVIIGGLIFGFGIVLAGGCATGTYYRSAEGLVGSWFALITYALFASIAKDGPLAPVTSWLRGATVPASTVYDTLGISPWFLVVALVIGVGLLVAHHVRRPKLPVAMLPARRTGLARIFFETPWGPFGAAVIIGILATLAWPLSAATGRNSGLGITTPSADLVAFFTTGDFSKIDWGVLLVLGILVGAFIAAKGSGEFRLRVPDAPTLLRALTGGALMGVGAAWAGGCTIGNAMVQTALFSYQGWAALLAMIAGTGLATYLLLIRPRAAARDKAAQNQTGRTSERQALRTTAAALDQGEAQVAEPVGINVRS
ncbi:YeeE/YedE family protein [Devriesea agamarum]|uniref:YeeE/YedE family protein n=1 Tax=Devriesea agamarum TaxID=472569 RepID=UPI00071CC697|nr:YeeE/YedE family protein [Devriesea agamarum]